MEEQAVPWDKMTPRRDGLTPSTGGKHDKVIDALREGLAHLNEAMRYADASPAIDAHARTTKEGLQLVATAISELARSSDRIADAVQRLADEVDHASMYL